MPALRPPEALSGIIINTMNLAVPDHPNQNFILDSEAQTPGRQIVRPKSGGSHRWIPPGLWHDQIVVVR